MKLTRFFDVLLMGLFIILWVGSFTYASNKSFYNKDAPVLSPWSGQYRHVSDKFELRLQQFAEDSLSVEIIEVQTQSLQSRASFFASIKNNRAIFQDRTDPSCKIELRRINGGIEFSDFCHGTGDDAGIYRPVH